MTTLILDTKNNKRDRRVSKAIREAAGETGTSIPIETVDGFDSPKVVGESWHYETKGGRRIHHPGAYSRRGWSNMRYVSSSRAIVVGRGWIIENTEI